MQKRDYRGNSNLKPRNVDIEWTPQILSEYIKCKDDPIYFCENYMKIINIDGGLISFNLYDFQRDIINSFQTNRKIIVNTSRQAGKTTIATGIILHFVLFNDYKPVALLANNAAAAREILSRIQLAYELLPKWLQQGVIEWSKSSVIFENGSKIYAAATSSSSIRGKTVALLYIDETAHVENWDEFFSAVYPTISSGKTTKLLLTSTPNGLNHFYYLFINAKEGKNGYVPFEVPWYDIPGRDDEWKEETMQAINFNVDKFNQEFCCKFLGSSGGLISGDALKSLNVQIPLSDNNNIKIYNEPQKGHFYVCVVDVARGVGGDYSAFTIFDISEMPYKQVATFRDRWVLPIEYAEIINRLITYYNRAYTLIEINDIGGQISSILYYDFEYENLISTVSAGRAGRKVTSGFGNKESELGVRTTTSVKSIGCSTLKMLIEQRQLEIIDETTITEISQFTRKGKSYEAESGAHDDTVMVLVLFAWLSVQDYFKEMTDIDTIAKLRRRSEAEMNEELMPFILGTDAAEDEIQSEKLYNYY